MKHFTTRLKYWLQIFLVPLYGMSYLMPRNKRIWLFGSTFGRRFSENPRYMFLYVAQHCGGKYQVGEAETDFVIEGVRPVWISHNKAIVAHLRENGYEAYYYHSMKGIWLALRGKVYLFDNYSKDINFWQSGRALKVNLWHGTGNKKVNHDNIHDKIRHPKNMWERWCTWLRRLSDEKPSNYTLTSSAEMAQDYARAFKTDISHILVNGNTRNDIFYPTSESGITNLYTEDEKAVREAILEASRAGKKIITYLPTFRESEKLFFDVMDMERFDRFLQEHNYVFAAKMHPKSRIKAAFEKVHGENIINIGAEIDLYSFFELCDMLITDYSSSYTDYMLTERPVVAFDYDWEEYSKDTRECYIDQDEYMPERKAITMEDLMRMIPETFENDACYEARMVSRKRMFRYVDGQSSKRMAHMVQDILNKR